MIFISYLLIITLVIKETILNLIQWKINKIVIIVGLKTLNFNVIYSAKKIKNNIIGIVVVAPFIKVGYKFNYLTIIFIFKSKLLFQFNN